MDSSESAAAAAIPLEGEELEQVLQMLRNQPDLPIVGVARARVIATLAHQKQQIEKLRASVRECLAEIRDLKGEQK